MSERGRPTDYRPEYCNEIIELGRSGKSMAEMAQAFNVTRTSLYEWASVHPEFSTALTHAREFAQCWWEAQAQQNLENRNFNSKLWEVTVRSRFKDDYTDTKKHIGDKENPVQVNHTGDLLAGLADVFLNAPGKK